MVIVNAPAIEPVAHHPMRASRPIRLALLGLGRVGAAVARLAADPEGPAAGTAEIVTALVRDRARRRDASLPLARLTTDPSRAFEVRPDVIVETLGGITPAFELVSRALSAGIPVVTANKSLLAAHGPCLEAIARETGTPLLCEAAVVAGVPFLGALAARPHAADVRRVEGILNGTSNFVLTRMAQTGCGLHDALADAQRRGYAEPHPSNDVEGIDAAEKLTVILRVLGWGSPDLATLERRGLSVLDTPDAEAARELGGVLKPVAVAERDRTAATAFVSPAFVPDTHPLAAIDGVENAIRLHTPRGIVLHRGPGAGPDATAATILDDAIEAVAGGLRAFQPRCTAGIGLTPASTPWLVRLESDRQLPAPDEIADLLASFGVWIRRSGATRSADGIRGATCLLTHAVERGRLERAAAAVAVACDARTTVLRALEN